MYVCMRCGNTFHREEMEEYFKDFRCPKCGYRILKKVRSGAIPRHVKAR